MLDYNDAAVKILYESPAEVHMCRKVGHFWQLSMPTTLVQKCILRSKNTLRSFEQRIYLEQVTSTTINLETKFHEISSELSRLQLISLGSREAFLTCTFYLFFSRHADVHSMLHLISMCYISHVSNFVVCPTTVAIAGCQKLPTLLHRGTKCCIGTYTGSSCVLLLREPRETSLCHLTGVLWPSSGDLSESELLVLSLRGLDSCLSFMGVLTRFCLGVWPPSNLENERKRKDKKRRKQQKWKQNKNENRKDTAMLKILTVKRHCMTVLKGLVRMCIIQCK